MQARIQRVQLPSGRRVLMVSDIHGHATGLQRLLEKAKFCPDDILVIVGDLVVNCQTRICTVAGQPVRLTAKEFDLLQLLITHRGKVYSREALLETVWKYDYMGDMRTVDVHIRRLREKIERDTSNPEFIMTKWGVGYYFTDKD